MIWANFTGAALNNANLRGTPLTNALFNEAYPNSANLSGTNPEYADFRDAGNLPPRANWAGVKENYLNTAKFDPGKEPF